MKKHPFLQVELQSSVKLKAQDLKKLNLWLNLASITLERLQQEKILKFSASSVRVSVLLCGDSKMKALNSQHRGKDKVTDVLSFPNHENLRSIQKNPDDSELFLGDLAICHPQVIRQAREFNISYFDEWIHLLFHGLIHLMGFDHELSAKEEKLMQKWEDRALSIFSEEKKREH